MRSSKRFATSRRTTPSGSCSPIGSKSTARPRANFIRTQIELVHTPPGTDEDERRRVVLFTRRDAALKAHGAAWLRPFHPYAREDSFVRGFVQKIDVPANTFLQHAEP
ncbi:hypothetical protein VT84_33505 [Gemmata sp. SH-PL17]|nr:hypothetical protein [Gemmata sp. SH-PL17]AMV29360.1 hypothetical protein VT84_33505 [Gemmata sp. SH-PL17]